jgi:tRNA G10  N-methylase Trm11
MKKLYQINLDFADFRKPSNAKLHWYPASFIPQIPNLILSHLAKSSQIVLDPFCGSGITIQEATKLGLQSIGMDNNPIASMINKVITQYYNLHNLKEYFDSEIVPLLNNTKSESVPDFPNKDLWYHPDTLKELGRIKYVISNVRSNKIKFFMDLTFSSILKQCSTQKDHYTYVADNMFPKKIDDKYYVQAISLFKNRFLANYHILHDYYESIQRAGFDPKNQIEKSHFIQQDVRDKWSRINEKVDIILTSPPYAGVTDYVKGQRLSFYWFPEWNFDNYLHAEIGARSKRTRKNFFDEYLEDIRDFITKSYQSLNKQGLLVLVIGQTSSIRRKQNLISNIKDIVIEENFELIADDLKRNIYFKQVGIVKGVKSESILIFKKGKS